MSSIKNNFEQKFVPKKMPLFNSFASLIPKNIFIVGCKTNRLQTKDKNGL